MSKPTIAILGASRDRHKFGNKAVRAYVLCGYQVFPINPQAQTIEGLETFPSLNALALAELDRASLYLPPEATLGILADLAQKKIGEIWLNPGSEHPEFIRQARARGLNIVLGCSILDIGVSPSSLE